MKKPFLTIGHRLFMYLLVSTIHLIIINKSNGQNCIVNNISSNPSSNLTSVQGTKEYIYRISTTSFSVCEYKWTVTNGLIVLANGLGTTEVEGDVKAVSVRWNNINAPGTLKVEVKNCSSFYDDCNGTVKTITPQITATPPNIPSMSIVGGYTYTNNQSAQIGCGIQNVTFSVPPVAFATSYEWDISGISGSIISGQGTPTIVVSVNRNSNGVVRVTPKNGNVRGNTFVLNITRPYDLQYGTLSGSGLVCNSGSQYSINTSASGYNVVWETTSQMNLSSTTGSSVTVSAAGVGGYGLGYVKARVYDVCTGPDSPIILQKEVYVGKPSTFSLNGPTTICIGGSATYYITNNNPKDYSNYTWTTNSSALGVDGNNVQGEVWLYMNGTHYFTVTAQNACGTTPYMLGINSSMCGGGIFSYQVYPNPSSETIIVNVISGNDNSMPEQINLISEKTGKTIKSIKPEKNANNKVQIDVRDIEKGNYYLHIINSKNKDAITDKIRILVN